MSLCRGTKECGGNANYTKRYDVECPTDPGASWEHFSAYWGELRSVEEEARCIQDYSDDRIGKDIPVVVVIGASGTNIQIGFELLIFS